MTTSKGQFTFDGGECESDIFHVENVRGWNECAKTKQMSFFNIFIVNRMLFVYQYRIHIRFPSMWVDPNENMRNV